MEKDNVTKEEWLEIVSTLRNIFPGSEKSFHISFAKTIASIYAFLAEVYADNSSKEKLIEFLEHFDIYDRIKIYTFITQKFSKYTKFRSQTIDYFKKMMILLSEIQFQGLKIESLLFVFTNNVTEIFDEVLDGINRIMVKKIGKENVSSYYKLTDSLIDSNLIFENNNMRYFEIAEKAFSDSPKHIYDSLARINTLIKLNRINEAYNELNITFESMTDFDHKSNHIMRLFLPLACSLKNEYLIDQLIKKNSEIVKINLEHGLDWGEALTNRLFFTKEKPESIIDSDWEIIKTKTLKYFQQNLRDYFIEPFDLPNFFSLVQMVKCLIYLDDTSNVYKIIDQIEIYITDLLLNYFPNELKQRFPEINTKQDLSNDRKEKFAQLLKNILRQIALMPIDQKEINFRAIEFAITNILELFTIAKNKQKLVQYYKINYEITNYYKEVYPFYETKVHYDEFFLKKSSNMFKTKKDELIALVGCGLGTFNIKWELTELLENVIKNYD